MSKKRSWTDEELISIVSDKEVKSKREILKRLRLSPQGGTYKVLDSHIKRLKLDTSHFTGQGHLKGGTHNWSSKREMSEILVENSPHKNNYQLKKRLIKEGYFELKCYCCNLTEWNGQPISLELEHKNGINNDNRIDNLTLLCPNCHAQTETYRGKNRKS